MGNEQMQITGSNLNQLCGSKHHKYIFYRKAAWHLRCEKKSKIVPLSRQSMRRLQAIPKYTLYIEISY